MSNNSSEFPEIPTEFRVKQVSARYADLCWSPSPTDAAALKAFQADTSQNASAYFMPASKSVMFQAIEKTVVYQVVKGTSNDAFEAVYEGRDLSCRVSNLVPNTKYRFKLRTRHDKQGAPLSDRYVQIECHTTQEDAILNAFDRLLKAIKANEVQTVIEILGKYIDDIKIDSTDREGHTLSMIACRFASGEMVELLLKAGASPNSKTTSGKSLISIAVTSQNLDACKVLVKYGANLNEPDNGGSTSLMWAVQTTSQPRGFEILEFLLDNGADPNALDNNGMSAFDRLCRSRSEVSYAKALVNAGANVIKEPTKTANLTSLMMAAQYGNSELCQFLLEDMGLDPKVRNANGYSASDFARTKGFHVLADRIDKFVPKPRVVEENEDDESEDD